MQITVSKNAGFCPGVRRADTEVHRLIKERADDELIYTLGDLIHNGVYNASLRENGVESISMQELEQILSDTPDKTVCLVIRTHGITKETEQALALLSEKHKNLRTVDMTCPYVKRIHDIAEEHTSDDTYFLLYGSSTHPESLGIISHAKGKKRIFSSHF